MQHYDRLTDEQLEALLTEQASTKDCVLLVQQESPDHWRAAYTREQDLLSVEDKIVFVESAESDTRRQAMIDLAQTHDVK